MDLKSLQGCASHCLGCSADHQSPGDSCSHAATTFAPGQSTSRLPGKAIGQRECVVDWPDDAESGGEYCDPQEFDVSLPDDLCDLPVRLPAARQQTLNPQESDDDGSWQVVTRRRSRHKRQESSAGKSDVWEKNGASPSRLPENSSADGRVTGQNQRLHSNGAVSLLATIPCSHRPLCIKSFARLGKVDWKSFHACLMKYQQSLQIKVTKNDFLRFRHMMNGGPRAIKRAEDAVFLADPFQVLLFSHELTDALFLSLVVECAAPGFLKMLGRSFVSSLPRIDEELFTAITELLAQICQGDERWLDRLGWQELPMRHRCNLFSEVSLTFKSINRVDLTRSLHRQISRSWLEKHHYALVKKLSQNSLRSKPDAHLRDLRASILANFCALGDLLFRIPETVEHQQLIVSYANIVKSVIRVTESLNLQPNATLLSVWRVVAQWSVRFRLHLSVNLGFDGAIGLHNALLPRISSCPELGGHAYELRLSLLSVVLTKCEDQLLRRDSTQACQTWCQHENILESLLGECRQFLRNCESNADKQSVCAQHINDNARLNLLLRESIFHRLGCEIGKSPRQQIQENLRVYGKTFAEEWALSRFHREIGTIELAKWYFLAGEHDNAVSSLVGVDFPTVSVKWKKADLLARHGEYRAAVDDYRQVRKQLTDRRKQDEVDDRIAMVLLRWYQAGGSTDHLVEAYRLSVALLGRCHIKDRYHFEGGLSHIVNTMKKSGLSFADFVGQTSVLGFMVREGCAIKSWSHFANLLHIRHKLGLTDVNIVHEMASEMSRKNELFLDLGKMA